MNRLEILKEVYGECDWTVSTLTHLIKVMELTAKAEREACAELAMKGTNEPVQTKTLEILRKERERIAAAIRARGRA